jgi:hypothetical protein
VQANLGSAKVQAGVADATSKAVDWLRKVLKQDGSNLKVSSKPLTSLAGIHK